MIETGAEALLSQVTIVRIAELVVFAVSDSSTTRDAAQTAIFRADTDKFMMQGGDAQNQIHAEFTEFYRANATKFGELPQGDSQR